MLDRCERVCICRSGQLRNCTRIRREFLHIPKKDRERYLSAVRLISTTEPWKSQYEALLSKRRNFGTSGREANNRKCIEGSSHYLGDKQDFEVSSKDPSSGN